MRLFSSRQIRNRPFVIGTLLSSHFLSPFPLQWPWAFQNYPLRHLTPADPFPWTGFWARDSWTSPDFEESIIWEREVKSQANRKDGWQRYMKWVMGVHKSLSNSNGWKEDVYKSCPEERNPSSLRDCGRQLEAGHSLQKEAKAQRWVSPWSTPPHPLPTQGLGNFILYLFWQEAKPSSS